MSQRIPFTHKGIEAIKPRPERFIIWDSKTRGFGLRVTPQGTRSFIVAYRFDGACRMLTLGSTDALTLEQALAQHGEVMAKVAGAKHIRVHQHVIPPAELDPAHVKRQRKEERRGAGTVADLWTAYQAKRCIGLRERTVGEYKRIMKAYVLDEIGERRVGEVTPKDIKALLNKVEATGPVMANRTRTLLAALFNFATDQFLVDASPVKLVRQVVREAPRARALRDEAELRGLYAALQATACSVNVKLALELVLTTAARPGEICGMVWADVDESATTWTIPPELDKTKQGRVVPLSALALALIEQAQSDGRNAVFVLTTEGSRPLTTHMLSHAVLLAAPHLAKHGVAKFTPHDLRRSARTLLSKLKVPRDIAELALGHAVKNKIVRTYDRHDFKEEIRAALDTLGAHLTTLRPGANVMPFTQDDRVAA